MKIILVAGIHGVGKSSICKQVSDELGFPYYTASQIIKNEKLSAVPDKSKFVEDVDENQKLLVQGVSKLLKKGNFLLDGHFTLLTKEGNIEHIPIDVFQRVGVSGVVLFTDNPEEIAKRILLRDAVIESIDSLKRHQDGEIEYAKHVASTLSIPLIILKSFDIDGMTQAIKSWIS
jgi:adenylate kinase